MIEHGYFYLGLAFLTIHEMDAIRCKEWRILPGLSSLKDQTRYTVFLLAHIPLFVWVFWALHQDPIHANFILGFDLFMLIHIGLHVLLMNHRHNEFKDWRSWTFIIGAGLFGLLDLVT